MCSAQPTNVQAALWPDQLPTDPATVAAIYDAKADSYGADTVADGWAATFDAMRPEFESFLDTRGSSAATRPLRVLDAGCGDGLLPEYISMPPGTELHGNDLSPKLVAAAQQKGFYASTVVADLSAKQPYESDTFDFIFCNGVLGYISSNAPVLNLLRVLAPGGRMVLCFRHAHFVERRYEDAILDSNSGAKLVRKTLFDPYPENDAYTHDYVCATIEKR
jgi:SAM-dependent methyltransferase